MSAIHVMHDIETLSLKPNALIISLGAVTFDKDGLRESFYQPVEISSQLGRHIDLGTVKWWMGQHPDARGVFAENGASLHAVLRLYNEWLRDYGHNDGVWANGSDFDNVVLTDAFRYCEATPHWSFYQHRCYRTIKSLYPDVQIERQGTHHNALDDARYQATHLLTIAAVRNIPL